MNPKYRQILITAEQAERIERDALYLMPKVNRLSQPTIHATARALIDYALAQLEKAKANESNQI